MMRVSSDIAELDLAPGNQADVTLNVVNTGSVIDGITARVVGLAERNVTTRPQVLPLFPDSSGQLTVTLGLPSSFPAGRHPMTVEVLSRQPNTGPQYVNLDVVVPTAPAVGLTSRPELIRARRTGRFVITVTNRGNIPLDVALRANDPEKAIGVGFEPATLTIPAGTAADSVVTLRGPRMFVGNEKDRTVTIGVAARPIGAGTTAPPAAPAALLAPTVPAPVAPGLPAVPAPGGPTELEPDPEEQAEPVIVEPLSREIIVTLRQRPWFTRGLLTALILLTIIALWACAFLFGLNKVFAGDPLTKAAPASFFAATQTDEGTGTTTAASGTGTAAVPTNGGTAGTGTVAPTTAGGGGSAAGGSGSGSGSGGSAAAAPPAGALPKAGTVPSGVGGVVSGTVTAKSSGEPVGRIIVTALRVRADGTTVAEASAASQADGTYEVAGLFPADYVLKFSADGYVTSYYPAAANLKAATRVPVTSAQVSGSINAVITGKPATITGSIDYGATTDKAKTTITVRLINGTTAAKPLPAVTTTNGQYSIPNVPAPGLYELSFSANGYQTSTIQTQVSAGATRYQPSVQLSAGSGQIVGTVTDGSGTMLGGVAVSTSINGQTVTTGTPTTGQVGQFTFSNVPMPGTYVITATKDGYGGVTQVIDLKPGVAQTPLKLTLTAGTGTVDGTLVDSTGAGIGGATVTVGGMANPTTTTTLTAGVVGSFHLTGIPSTGSFTLTFTMPGYADLTVPVPEGAAAQQPMRVTMTKSVGGISGTVTNSSGVGLINVTVTATDGVHQYPVSTTGNANGSGAGAYEIADLPAGVYTVTAADTTGDSTSAIVTVVAGKTVTQNFTITTGT